MVEEYWQEFGTESSIFPVLAAGWVPFALATQSSGAGEAQARRKMAAKNQDEFLF